MSGFMVNKAGAKIYMDVSKHEELHIEDATKYNVLSVGIVGSQRTAIATVQENDGVVSAYRLPVQLDDWVQTSMLMSAQGLNVFPAAVEFGRDGDDVYAEIL